MAGYYFLLHDFIDANQDEMPKQVIVLVRPGTLGNDLDKYAFQYFLKPMYNRHYKGMMNDHLLERIHQVPMFWMTQVPFIKYTDWFPNRSVAPSSTDGLFSQISIDYIDSIAALCTENNISFSLVSTIISENERDVFLQMSQQAIPIDTTLFMNYVNSFQFLPESLFVDGVHLREENIPTDFLDLTHAD